MASVGVEVPGWIFGTEERWMVEAVPHFDGVGGRGRVGGGPGQGGNVAAGMATVIDCC